MLVRIRRLVVRTLAPDSPAKILKYMAEAASIDLRVLDVLRRPEIVWRGPFPTLEDIPSRKLVVLWVGLGNQTRTFVSVLARSLYPCSRLIVQVGTYLECTTAGV